jgi:hypothetical protein
MDYRFSRESLSLSPELAERIAKGADKGGRKVKRKPGAFIKGPIALSWMQAAAALGASAASVGLMLWHLHGLTGDRRLLVSNIRAKSWSVSPDAKWRALRALASAGLIKLTPRGRRSPFVEIVL